MEMSSVAEISRLINELYVLIITYLKEQTIIPLKRVIRYVGMGIVGSLFISFGVLLISIGFLRYLQSITVFHDTFSFVPYIVVSIIDIAAIGVFFNIMTQESLIKERNDSNDTKRKNK